MWLRGKSSLAQAAHSSLCKPAECCSPPCELLPPCGTLGAGFKPCRPLDRCHTAASSRLAPPPSLSQRRRCVHELLPFPVAQCRLHLTTRSFVLLNASDCHMSLIVYARPRRRAAWLLPVPRRTGSPWQARRRFASSQRQAGGAAAVMVVPYHAASRHAARGAAAAQSSRQLTHPAGPLHRQHHARRLM